MQEGRIRLEQLFFPISLFGILYSIFFYLFDRLEMALRTRSFSFFAFRETLNFCVVARWGWNHKYGDILENILASFAQFYSVRKERGKKLPQETVDEHLNCNISGALTNTELYVNVAGWSSENIIFYNMEVRSNDDTDKVVWEINHLIHFNHHLKNWETPRIKAKNVILTAKSPWK